MSERTLSLRRFCLPRRRGLALAVLCVLLAAGLAQLESLAGRSSAVAPGRALSAGELSRLPLAAQAAVSDALGAELPAYRIAEAGGGSLAARNPAQGLEATFGPSGVTLGSSGGSSVTMRLSSIGYGSALTPVGSAAAKLKGSRVSYAHPGVTEWYANGPLGIDQGFTLARPPAHLDGAGGELTLAVGVAGADGLTLGDGGRSVRIDRSGALALTYGGLFARDARGHVLGTSLGVEGGRLIMRVEDRGASYPLEIDPMVAQDEALLPEGRRLEQEGGQIPEAMDEPPAGSRLGYSVAVSSNGATAIVGAPDYGHFTGAAWVFTRSSEGTWTEQATLTTPEEAEEGGTCEEGDEDICAFGRSVALSGDGNTALVGGPRQAHDRGAAWFFVRKPASGGGEAEWSLQTTLHTPEPDAEGRFGRGVALSADGRTAAIGATAIFDGHGAAWVYVRSGGEGEEQTWSEQGSSMTGGEQVGEAHFGVNMALSSDGSTLIVGGPADAGYRGAAWVFTRSASNSWSQVGGKLTGGEEVGDAHFGYSVALAQDGSTALVGGPFDDEDIGAAWGFVPAEGGGGWVQEGPKLTDGEGPVERASEGRLFGYSVALDGDGDLALVGAPRDGGGTGAAWLLESSGEGGWSSVQKLVSSEGSGGKARFGSSVGLRTDGGEAIVGAPSEHHEAGAAWVFGQRGTLPVVNSVEPSSGPAAGGTVVTIEGERLAGASAVDFGESVATFSRNADGSITATSPAHVPGSVCVTVTTPEGQSNGGSSCAHFEYQGAAKPPGKSTSPVIVAIAPRQGPTTGGTLVTITGRNLQGATSVAFGGVSAARFSVVSATEITAVTGAEGEGEVPVHVSGPTGTGTSGAGEWFLFQPPLAGVGALAYGPVKGCRVTLLSRTIPVQARKRALVKVSMGGQRVLQGSPQARGEG